MKSRFLLLVAFACLSVSGCGDSPESPGQKSRGLIGVSLLTLENPFFKVIGDTITEEGAKHGYETLVVSGDKDVAKQSNQIKDFIVKGAARGPLA